MVGRRTREMAEAEFLDELSALVELRLVEVLQEALRLADDRPAQAYDHPPADDLRLDDKVPRLVEQRAEARQVQRGVLLRADADHLGGECVRELSR